MAHWHDLYHVPPVFNGSSLSLFAVKWNKVSASKCSARSFTWLFCLLVGRKVGRLDSNYGVVTT